MNVSAPQPQASLRESSIRKELRKRKQLVSNEGIEDVRPFKTYRKRIDPEENQEQRQSEQKRVQNETGVQIKLKRQYPAYSNDKGSHQSQLKQTKYKYDIESKVDQNSPHLGEMQHKSKDISAGPVNQPSSRPSMMRKNIKSLQAPFLTSTSGGRKEVQSIIFDSKVTRYQNIEEKHIKSFTISEDYLNERSIRVFQDKVNQVNSEIQAGLTNLEKMICDLKKKKVAQSQIAAQLKAKSRLEQLERQFAQRRAECRQKEEEKQLQTPEQVKRPLDKQLVTTLMQNEKKLKAALQKAASPPRHQNQGTADSHIQLQGDINNKKNSFPPEYKSFINRLANQIEKDIQFTSKITELTKSNNLQSIKTLILDESSKNQDNQIDQSFLQLEPSQIDPLDQGKPAWYKIFPPEALQKEAMQVYKMYTDIEGHFRAKLHHKFDLSVIKLLFEELAQFNFTKSALNDTDSVTVGHLLSYLNMRTNKSFRNRSFVKMLKRLGLRSNSFLSVHAFSRLIVQ